MVVSVWVVSAAVDVADVVVSIWRLIGTLGERSRRPGLLELAVIRMTFGGIDMEGAQEKSAAHVE